MDFKIISEEDLEQVAGGVRVQDITGRHNDRKRDRLALANEGGELEDTELDGIAGGVLDKDIIAEWKDEVAYARFRMDLPFDDLMALLAETEYDFSAAEMQELRAIAGGIYDMG